MSARIFADLNPAYPSKGQHRYAILRREGNALTIVGKSYRSRRSAERAACELQTRASLEALGIKVTL
jgi:hypothetical protein